MQPIAGLLALLAAMMTLHVWSLLRFPAPFVDEAWVASRAGAFAQTGRAFLLSGACVGLGQQVECSEAGIGSCAGLGYRRGVSHKWSGKLFWKAGVHLDLKAFEP